MKGTKVVFPEISRPRDMTSASTDDAFLAVTYPSENLWGIVERLQVFSDDRRRSQDYFMLLMERWIHIEEEREDHWKRL